MESKGSPALKFKNVMCRSDLFLVVFLVDVYWFVLHNSDG